MKLYKFSILIFTLFMFCSPQIRFSPPDAKQSNIKLFINKIKDARPVNEHVGYKIFYVSSISDADYKQGFAVEFRRAISDAMGGSFQIVEASNKADLMLDIEVLHFYGEYSQSVKSVFLEYTGFLCLYIPRLITDAIPYNHFAGRAKFSFRFNKKTGIVIKKKIDVLVSKKVSTYNRSPAATVSMLGHASETEIHRIIREVKKEYMQSIPPEKNKTEGGP